MDVTERNMANLSPQASGQDKNHSIIPEYDFSYNGGVGVGRGEGDVGLHFTCCSCDSRTILIHTDENKYTGKHHNICNLFPLSGSFLYHLLTVSSRSLF